MRKGYWKRLKNHPGLIWGIILPSVMAVTILSNKSFDVNRDWMGLVAATGTLAITVWALILWSNYHMD